MARIAGVEIPNEKRIVISLTYIFGIGETSAEEILEAVNIDRNLRTSELGAEEVRRIAEYIDKNIPTEGQVRQKVFRAIKRHRDNRSYRGTRHKKGLPVRGQNTRQNARTRKGKGKTIANKKKVAH